MKLYSENENYKLYQGNMLDMLESIEPNSIDSIITDPPYELNFMGKGWDNSGIAFQKETWEKCYKVLKSGGYLLAFGGSRTFHRIACAIEDAGFEIRDTIMWLYGSGFPKSMNIGLALDKKNGVESKIVGYADTTMPDFRDVGKKQKEISGIDKLTFGQIENSERKETPIYEAQNKWNGWGTALKPSFEPIIVARKPFKGSLVDNVIEYGVGGINIDECRVGNETIYSLTKDLSATHGNNWGAGTPTPLTGEKVAHEGRFPANTILTYDDTDFEEVCGGFPVGKRNGSVTKPNQTTNSLIYGKNAYVKQFEAYNDSGSASRYFMNCKYTGKDEEIWKQLLVNNVESNLEILKVTKDNIVQMNVEDLLKELKDHYAKYVENQLDLIETPIVQDIAKILNWDFKIETSQVIQDFIGNYSKCSQFLKLVQFVEKMDNIDTTQTTQNLLKLFGYVKVVITNYIIGNIKLEQRRYLYTPKASKKDRDEGLDNFEEEKVNDGRNTPIDNAFQRGETLRKNTHPTVKPTELMQYLVRLVSPDGATILDPFNGSGSTGKAVMYENKERNKNYKYIGIELTDEYLPISKARIEYVCNLEPEKDNQLTIFDFIGDEENENIK